MRRRHIAERCVVAALLAAGVILPAAALARRRADPPALVLFIRRGCPHCAAAAVRFDSLPNRHAIIDADSGSGRALARLLGVAAVPALVTISAVVRYDFAR